MSEVVHDVMPGHPVAVLTGPNLAKEILSGQAAAAVVAMADDFIASFMAVVSFSRSMAPLMPPNFRGSF